MAAMLAAAELDRTSDRQPRLAFLLAEIGAELLNLELRRDALVKIRASEQLLVDLGALDGWMPDASERPGAPSKAIPDLGPGPTPESRLTAPPEGR